MSVTFVTFSALQALQGVTLCYIGLKSEFLNSFVSLIRQRYKRYMFACVYLCPLKPCFLFKDKNKYYTRRRQDSGGVR